MAEPGTVPLRSPGTPVRQLRLEVVEGPDAGAAFTTDGETATIGAAEGNDLQLSDPTVSRFHFELRRRGAQVEVRDLGSTNGTQVGPATVHSSVVRIPPGTAVTAGQSRVRVDDGEVVMVERGPSAIGGIHGRAPAMRRLLETVARMATRDAPVLITGESGTGKELIARALHEQGPRAEEPFVTVDCGAVPPSLFSSELFGHERGAFTGADRQSAGAFERASSGTLFLDEIGELPGELQSTLLGVLERRCFRRVGGNEELQTDARVVAATNRDLRADVNQGAFRLDLYYRLAVVDLHVPPLRERPEDIAVLVEQLLRDEGYEGAVEDVLSEETMEAFRKHHWPGNVRELRNAVRRTLTLGSVPELSPRAAGQDGGDSMEAVLSLPYRQARRVLTDEFEQRYLRHLLDRTHGNIRAAAREGQMDRSYLIELLKRHGLA
jgi:DNA-binding NtrC family response regulator